MNQNRTFISIVNMINHGFSSIGFNQKRDYSKYISHNLQKDAENRWHDLEIRMRQSANKVIQNHE